MPDDWYEIPNYPDMIVIPFEIPWRTRSGELARRARQQERDRAAEDRWAGAWPDHLPDVAPPDPVAVSWPQPESRLIIAGVRGHPALAVSGASNGELTLWRRRTDTAEPQALATFTLDLDGSQLWAADGQFAGRLFEHNETVLLHPDWLRSIGADLQHGASELLGVPEVYAQEEEEPARRFGPGGRELSPPEELRLYRFNEAVKELKKIEPDNPQIPSLSTPEWIPDELTVEKLEAELARARARATRSQGTVPEHRPYPGEPGGIPLRIEQDKQDKHIPGHKNFVAGRSVLLADPQQLLETYANKGTPIPTSAQRGEPGFRERFDTGGQIIGVYIDPKTGEAAPTTRGMIIYSKRGAHIVPVRPPSR